jgi:roadblock/LC7 domain-containing protein
MNKKFFGIIALAGCFTAATAQKSNLVSAIKYLEDYSKYHEIESLNKAKSRIDTAAKHPDTKEQAKTWFNRGEIYYTIFYNDLTLASLKAPGDPQQKTVTALQSLSLDNLETALTSYQKTIDLDTKKDYTEKARVGAKNCLGQFYNKAYAMYVVKDFGNALAYAEKSADYSEKLFNLSDTSAYILAAYCAVQTKDNDKAAKYYNKLIELKSDPVNNYGSLIGLYEQSGDNEKYKAAVAKARAAYPNELSFIYNELNIAIKEGKTDQALASLKIAIEKDPKNISLYLVQGETYSQLAFPEVNEGKKGAKYDEYTKKAEESYLKALEINPADFKANYNIGAYYNNIGAQISNAANKLTDMTKIAKEEKKAAEIFNKAIVYLEKAYEQDKTDRDTMTALKQLYIKTNQTETEKYKKIAEQLKN